MWNTFKYTLLGLVRMPGVLVWALAFPLILSTVFMMMFGPLDDQTEIDPIPIVVVETADDADGQSFQAFLDALSDGEDGEAPSISPTSPMPRKQSQSQGKTRRRTPASDTCSSWTAPRTSM